MRKIRINNQNYLLDERHSFLISTGDEVSIIDHCFIIHNKGFVYTLQTFLSCLDFFQKLVNILFEITQSMLIVKLQKVFADYLLRFLWKLSHLNFLLVIVKNDLVIVF